MLLAGNLLATTSGDLVYLDFACYLQATCWLLFQETWSTVCREPASYYFRRLGPPGLCMLLAGNLPATTSGDLVYLDFAGNLLATVSGDLVYCLQGTCWLLLQETWST